MKPFLSSFRAKLIFTIFPVVAGITIAGLLWAEWRFSAAYQRLFEEQFDQQIAAVRQARDRRIEVLSKVLEQLAASPAVIDAMRRQDYAGALMRLRPVLEPLGSERLQTESANAGRSPPNRIEPRARAGAPPSPLRPTPGQPLILLVKPDGEIAGQRLAAGAGSAADNDAVRRRSGRMAWRGDRPLEEVLKQQETAYFLFESPERRTEVVNEVFVTPFRDPANGRFLGALIFGLPMPIIADRLLYEQSKRSEYGEIMGGTYVEGKLVSSTVPEDLRPAVAEAISQSLNQPNSEVSDIVLRINGERHRLMYRVLNPNSPFPRAVQVNFYSLAALDQEIFGLRRSALAFGVIALLVALLLVLIISRSLSGPISNLVSATAEIQRGNYEVRVPVTKDEVGQLAASFNDMASGLALQNKYRSVLHAVADRSVAERLIEEPEALSGEVREVAMLFCDIRGFTALTEKMPPQDVVELLNEHMTALTKVAYEHGGIVDKFVGDLIMVLFGAPISNGDDALRAVRCAQEMVAVRRQLNKTSRHSLEIGIGIATGSVVAGCMGSGQRLTYTVLGHRVNLASRLCSIAQPGEIVTDDITATPLNGSVNAVPLDPVHLKGFSHPVRCYRIEPVSLAA
jgi:class 3 adenylate cyclase